MFQRGKWIVGLLVCSVLCTMIPVDAYAGIGGTECFDCKPRSFSAGAHHAICETVVWNDGTNTEDTLAVTETDKPVSADAEAKEEDACENIAVCQCKSQSKQGFQSIGKTVR